MVFILHLLPFPSTSGLDMYSTSGVRNSPGKSLCKHLQGIIETVDVLESYPRDSLLTRCNEVRGVRVCGLGRWVGLQLKGDQSRILRGRSCRTRNSTAKP